MNPLFAEGMALDPGGLIAWLLVGLVAGWLAGLVMPVAASRTRPEIAGDGLTLTPGPRTITLKLGHSNRQDNLDLCVEIRLDATYLEMPVWPRNRNAVVWNWKKSVTLPSSALSI